MALERFKKINTTLRDNRLARSAVAITAAAALLVGGLFNTPSDLLKTDKVTADTAIVEMIDTDPGDDGDGDEGVSDEEKKGVRAKLRSLLLRLPFSVRVLCVLPLWGIGWVMITGGSALFSAFLSPALGAILKWLCITALVFAAIVATIKVAFPDVPLKELLTKKNLTVVIICAVLLGIAGTLLDLIYPEYRWLTPLVDTVCSCAVAAWMLISAKLKLRKHSDTADIAVA